MGAEAASFLWISGSDRSDFRCEHIARFEIRCRNGHKHGLQSEND